MQKIDETQLYSPFVAPSLCKELADAGFLVTTTHQWYIYHNEVKLDTNAFDPDGYYSDGAEVINALHSPDYILPAYTIIDCAKVLEPYQVAVNSFESYQLGVQKYFDQVGYVTAPRLPDVFATYLLKAIQEKAVDVNTINSKSSA